MASKQCNRFAGPQGIKYRNQLLLAREYSPRDKGVRSLPTASPGASSNGTTVKDDVGYYFSQQEASLSAAAETTRGPMLT